MRTLLIRLAAVAALAGGPPAQAAPEFRAGYGTWRYDISGTATDRDRTYDLQRDLELETSGRRSIAVEWDTPGRWPDLAVSFSQVGAAGDAEYQSVSLDLLGNPLFQDETVAATADFDDFDVTARYPFALGPLQAAAGLTVKRLKGSVLIDDSGRDPPQSRQQYDETVPELHGQLRWPLARWLVVGATAQGISYDGNRALEWRASAELLLGPLRLEAGWQEKRYEVNLTDYALDARLDGVLARIGFVFR